MNYLTVGVVTAGEGDGCPPLQPTKGRAPAEKRVLEYLELEKTHLISLSLTFP